MASLAFTFSILKLSQNCYQKSCVQVVRLYFIMFIARQVEFLDAKNSTSYFGKDLTILIQTTCWILNLRLLRNRWEILLFTKLGQIWLCILKSKSTGWSNWYLIQGNNSKSTYLSLVWRYVQTDGSAQKKCNSWRKKNLENEHNLRRSLRMNIIYDRL